MSTEAPDIVDAGTLFRRHATFVARVLYRCGVVPSEVDDAVQEVFLTAHRHGGFEARTAKESTWLVAIAVRVASNRRRSARRRREHGDERSIEAAIDGLADPSRVAQARAALRRVQRALESLDDAHRSVFVLYELENMSAQAISDSLSIPVGTVHSRLSVARKRFVQAHRRLIVEDSDEARRVG